MFGRRKEEFLSQFQIGSQLFPESSLSTENAVKDKIKSWIDWIKNIAVLLYDSDFKYTVF